MKKFWFVLLIVVVYPMFLQVGAKAICADGDQFCNGFVKVPDALLCDPKIAESLSEAPITIELNTDQKNVLMTKLGGVCVKKTAPDFVVSYIGPVLPSLVVGKDGRLMLGPTSLILCPKGYQAPFQADGKSYLEATITWPCCPTAYPYSSFTGFGCAAQFFGPNIASTALSRPIIALKINYNNTDVWEINDVNDYLTNPTLSAYICGSSTGEGCAATAPSDGYIEADKFNKYLTIAKIGSTSCIQNTIQMNRASCLLMPDKNGNTDADSCMCYNNASISKNLYAAVGATGVAVLNSCKGLPNKQSNQCVQCMMQNFTTDATGKIVSSPKVTFSSSFGCIETSQNGIVTTVMRIGIGIASGIILLRIMQGVFMRQTNDPAKIQEGNEVITSAVLALIVLVGAVFIFRVIGVDILGIFTQQQFISITN